MTLARVVGRNHGKGDLLQQTKKQWEVKIKITAGKRHNFFKIFGYRDVRNVGQCLEVCLLEGEVILFLFKY